jgi:hypothetical protein
MERSEMKIIRPCISDSHNFSKLLRKDYALSWEATQLKYN